MQKLFMDINNLFEELYHLIKTGYKKIKGKAGVLMSNYAKLNKTTHHTPAKIQTDLKSNITSHKLAKTTSSSHALTNTVQISEEMNLAQQQYAQMLEFRDAIKKAFAEFEKTKQP